MDSFKIIRHINRIMVKYGVPMNGVSHDTPSRIISIARRSLESESEQMVFFKSGNRWGAGIERIKD